MRPEYKFSEAALVLRQNGIEVVDEAFGFSVSGEDAAGKMKAECGIDNDGSVSISVSSEKLPVAWFFRPTAAEIASLLISAKQLLSEKKKANWIEALKALDTHENL